LLDTETQSGFSVNVNGAAMIRRQFMKKMILMLLVVGSGSFLLSACGNNDGDSPSINQADEQVGPAPLTMSKTAPNPATSTAPAAPTIVAPQVTVGQVALFAISNPDGNLTYSWSFGNGGAHTQLVPYYVHGEPTGAGQPVGSVIQTYSSSGSYPVSLTATNSSGLSTTSSIDISVVDDASHNVATPSVAVQGATVPASAVAQAQEPTSVQIQDQGNSTTAKTPTMTVGMAGNADWVKPSSPQGIADNSSGQLFVGNDSGSK
jgi:hypothetical protein